MGYNFSSHVEVYEIKQYEITGKTKQDATEAVKALLESEDELINVIAQRGNTWMAKVRKFRLRDYPV
jgi:hypothetical protein